MPSAEERGLQETRAHPLGLAEKFVVPFSKARSIGQYTREDCFPP